MIQSLLSDIRLALRGFRHRPGFALAVTLTLALGTGATTAVLAVVQGVLIRPLPFPDSDELAEIRTISLLARENVYGTSLLEAEDFAAGVEGIDALGVYREMRTNLIPQDRAIPAHISLVTGDFFNALRTPPLLGRTFEPDDDRPGGDAAVAVLSHRTWQALYGGERDIVGQTIRTAMQDFQIVGVMPEGFEFPGRTDLWVPMQSYLDSRQIDRGDPAIRGVRIYYRSVVRLADGATVSSAGAEVAAVSRMLQGEFPETNRDFEHRLIGLRDAEAAVLRPYLLLLLGAVGLVLAICCANIANLFVARSVSRTREIGVRTALGAGRGRLARQLLTESLVLAVAGALVGLALAWWGVELFRLSARDLLPAWALLEIDGSVLALCGLMALACGAVIGLAPVIHAIRLEAGTVVRGGTRVVASGGPLRPALVTAQVGLSMILLVGAGLLLASLDRLERVDEGLGAERVLTVSMSAFREGPNEERIRNTTSYYREVIDRLEQLPSVEAVGGTDNFPYGSRYLADRNTERIEVRGDSDEELAHRAPAVLVDVTPDYFDALGIPLIEGRAFDEGDHLDAPWVIILSETGARTLFPDRPALGQEVRMTYEGGGVDPWAQVVGIVGDVKYDKREAGDGIELYYPYTQWGLASTTLAIRTRGATTDLLEQVREIVHAVDPETAVEEIRPLGALIEDSLWRERLWGGLVTAFAGLALVLAAVGIYGVVSYSVASRTQEVGVRMALGSKPRDVVALVTRHGMLPVLLGMVLGTALSLALVPLVRSLLFQAGSLDVVSYVVPGLLLAVVSFAACLQPALRAARIDPVRALRREL